MPYGNYGGYGPGKSKGMAYKGTGPKPGIKSSLMKIGGTPDYGTKSISSGSYSGAMSYGGSKDRGIGQAVSSSESIIKF
jgi:hypothetical protein